MFLTREWKMRDQGEKNVVFTWCEAANPSKGVVKPSLCPFPPLWEHAEGKITKEKGAVIVLVLLSCTSFWRGIADFDVKALTPIQGLVFFRWSHQN